VTSPKGHCRFHINLCWLVSSICHCRFPVGGRSPSWSPSGLGEAKSSKKCGLIVC